MAAIHDGDPTAEGDVMKKMLEPPLHGGELVCLKGWKVTPFHSLNRDLATVWLAR